MKATGSRRLPPLALAIGAMLCTGPLLAQDRTGEASREVVLQQAGFESDEGDARERSRAGDHAGAHGRHAQAHGEHGQPKTGAAARSGESQDAFREGQLWAAFELNPALQLYDIEAEVQGDRATLTGQVETPTEKQLASVIAARLPGIERVDNRIGVDSARAAHARAAGQAAGGRDARFAARVSDVTTAALIDSKLLWNAHTHDNVDDIRVRVQDGVVTLSGFADTQHASRVAERLARDTAGVTAVNNRIRTDPADGQVAVAAAPEPDPRTLGDAWIAAKTESMLRWSSGVRAEQVQVRASDGVVQLSGEVGNDFARQLAIELAQDVRGVRRVDASRLHTRSDEALSQR